MLVFMFSFGGHDTGIACIFVEPCYLNTFVPATCTAGPLSLRKLTRVRFRHRNNISLASLTERL